MTRMCKEAGRWRSAFTPGLREGEGSGKKERKIEGKKLRKEKMERGPREREQGTGNIEGIEGRN